MLVFGLEGEVGVGGEELADLKAVLGFPDGAGAVDEQAACAEGGGGIV